MRLLKIILLVLLALDAAYLLAQSGGKTGSQKPAAGAPPDKAAVQRGQAAYQRYCAICHFNASTAKKVGPGLKNLYKRGAFADGKKVEDATVQAWIEAGGKNMPGFKDSINAEQLRNLIAYLKTL